MCKGFASNPLELFYLLAVLNESSLFHLLLKLDLPSPYYFILNILTILENEAGRREPCSLVSYESALIVFRVLQFKRKHHDFYLAQEQKSKSSARKYLEKCWWNPCTLWIFFECVCSIYIITVRKFNQGKWVMNHLAIDKVYTPYQSSKIRMIQNMLLELVC